MSSARWLNLKEFFFLLVLLIFSSMVAVSDVSDDKAGASSYASTTDLLVYGLVGSSLLSKD